MNPDVIGTEAKPRERSWTSADALLYAVAVGSGSDDPTTELLLTTENSAGVEQQVLPTFAVLLAGPSLSEFPELGEIDRTAVVHGEQSVEVHVQQIPTSGTCRSVSRIVTIEDKGHAAVVRLESTATDIAPGAELFTVSSAAFVKGAGGGGGTSQPTTPWILPERRPDHIVELQTRPEQALIYRLCGDRNPLHSDPDFAQRAGFERPILHGLATYGFTGRAVLKSVGNGDPSRLHKLSGRFASPVIPGDKLTVQLWEGERVLLRTLVGDRVVIDRGVATLRG